MVAAMRRGGEDWRPSFCRVGTGFEASWAGSPSVSPPGGSVARQMPYSHTNGHIDGRPCCTPRWGRELGIGSARHRSVRDSSVRVGNPFDTPALLLVVAPPFFNPGGLVRLRELPGTPEDPLNWVPLVCSCRVSTNRHLPLAWARGPQPWRPRDGRHETTRRSNSNADEEPPAKRPRLKLNLREPSPTDGDTIAVSRPKRTSAARRRYSEDVVTLDNEAKEPTVKQSPATSSGLSSPVSVTASVRSGMLSIKTNHATRNAAHLVGGECRAK
jgi:hypothetical protein